jgi:hypothetical protein
MKKKAFLLSVLLTIVLIGCDDSSNSEHYTTNLWVEDGEGFIQFTTNDPQYYGYGFYKTYNDPNTPMTVIESTVKRMSGYNHMGYGVVFCYQDIDNFYKVMITVNGSFHFSVKKDGVYTILEDWQAGNGINTGYGVENTIEVTFDGTDTFTITFNGNATSYEYTDTTFSSGASGFTVSIGSDIDESFPSVPVDCRYKQLQPSTQP